MTLVIDASALTEYLLSSTRGQRVAELLATDRQLHLPHLAVVETVSALRGWVHSSQLSEGRARSALIDLADLPATRWASEPLLDRIWGLRDNISAYDATYVALAESLDATLLTCDIRLARIAGQIAGCPIVTVS
jgi:predicted nucleic acid-binding protein